MNREIKENNSVMKCCICNNENIGEFIVIDDKKYHLNCITNLQEENERQAELISRLYNIIDDDKENFKLLGEEIDKETNDYCFELKNYKSRNEKAIEFVKKESKKCYTNQPSENPLKVIGNFMWHTDELLNILQGSKEK